MSNFKSGSGPELAGKVVILTDDKAETVDNIWLDEFHGLRISTKGHEGRWPVSTADVLNVRQVATQSTLVGDMLARPALPEVSSLQWSLVRLLKHRVAALSAFAKILRAAEKNRRWGSSGQG